MITDVVTNRINNLIDGQIRALEKRRDDDEHISCACCVVGEIDDDIESLNKLKEYFKNFKDE